MSNTLKRLIVTGLTVVTVVGMSGAVAPARAQTIAELQAQIAALLAQIQQLQAQLAAQQAGGAGVPVQCSFTRDLFLGRTGEDVQCLQRYLNAAGFELASSGPGSPGNETQFYGPLTKDAVARWQAANNVSPSAGYFGSLSRAKYSELAAAGQVPVGGQPQPEVPASGLVVRLAADNPASQVVPKGASGVEFLKFELAGNGTVSSLTFERVGLGATTDFGSVYLYEGSTRLTSGKTINSTTHRVFFPALNLSVSGVRTLSLVADVASGANAGDRNGFTLVEVVGSPSPTGAPLSGNTFEIGGQSVGSVTVSAGSAPSNPSVGQRGALLAEFKLSAGTGEDIRVQRVALTEGGSIANDKLSNFELRVADQVVATANAIGLKDLLTFEFSEPYLIEKGQVKTFRLYGDVDGTARKSDTVAFYVGDAADVSAVGAIYGYNVNPTIDSTFNDSSDQVLTLQAGQVTVAFSGPVAGDIALRAQDVPAYEFSITAQNNIEIRNLRLDFVLTGSGQRKFNDVKVWDADTGQVVTSAVDVSSSTASPIVFTDTINIAAGQTRNFRVTVDVDSADSDSDTIQFTLNAFQSGDIKNLDNNTDVATADIVGVPATGNVMTVRVPSLDIQLAGTPTSQTFVRGTQNVDLVGFALRAVAADITVTQLKVTASSTGGGTLTASELQSLGLYDGSTRLGALKSLDSSLTATFDNFTLLIPKGQTKVLTVKANLAADATNNDKYYVYIKSLDDVGARDADGNSLSSAEGTLTGSTANSGGSVVVTVTNVGDVTVALAPDDVESEAGIVVMNGERTLAKFRFTAQNESMTVNDFDLLVNGDNTSTATSTAAVDEVPTLKLYDGGTLLASAPVIGSGSDAGKAFVRSLGWVIPKDTSKTLTVKGVVNSSSAGADSGAEVAVHFLTSNFKAQGATANDTTPASSAISANEKIVYKTRPTISVAHPGTTLTTGEVKVLQFTVSADQNEQLAWRKIQLKVSMTDATMSGATTANVRVRDAGGSNLTLATVHSAATTTSTGANAITGGNTGYVSITLSTPQEIAAGGSKTYEVFLTFADVDAGGNGGASAVVSLNLQESTVFAATSYANVEGTDDGKPSFIWSDFSVVGHDLTTADWANGVYVKELPSSSVTISQ